MIDQRLSFPIRVDEIIVSLQRNLTTSREVLFAKISEHFARSSQDALNGSAEDLSVNLATDGDNVIDLVIGTANGNGIPFQFGAPDGPRPIERFVLRPPWNERDEVIAISPRSCAFIASLIADPTVQVRRLIVEGHSGKGLASVHTRFCAIH